MYYRKKRKWIIDVLLLIGIFCGILYVQDAVQSAFVKDSQRKSQAVLNFFYENLAASLECLDYAKPLSYIVNSEDNVDMHMFTEIASNMLKTDEHIVFLAYFEGDKIKAIYPEDEFGIARESDLHDFSYSYTLAKVIREAVVEGPELLAHNGREVFLFISPIVNGTEYKGEIVAAVDSDYVLSQMGFDLLKNGGYDYELWRVNALGEHKSVIAVSDPDIDFSDALKFTFNLPSTWALSIIPEGGWFSSAQKWFTYVVCTVLGLLIIISAALGYRYFEQRKELLRARYIEPDSGLFDYNGFCIFLNQKIRKRPQAPLCLLFIRLSGFHMLSTAVSNEEILEYWKRIRKNMQESFSSETLAARLNTEIIAIALFADKDDKKTNENIEEFILQLFWKKHINGKKNLSAQNSAWLYTRQMVQMHSHCSPMLRSVLTKQVRIPQIYRNRMTGKRMP